MISTLFEGLRRDLWALVRVYRGWLPGPVEVGNAPEVAVVLGAQVLREERPSRTLAARTRHAARLYAAGEVKLLVMTGGTGKNPPSEARVMAGVLREAGVPERDILLEEEARNTRDSAWMVADMLRERGIGAVRVVTDPLHCVRTASAFAEAGLTVSAEPVYGSPMWSSRWLRRGQLAREAGAMVWYRLGHRIGLRLPQ